MNSKTFTRRVFSICLNVAIIATISSLVLAATGKAIGELSINNLKGESPQVRVNNELAQSGHTVFSNNTITTPENAGATVNFGKFGSVELAPNSVVNFTANDNGLVGELNAGQITAFSDALIIKTIDGKTLTPKSGESVSANGIKSKDDDERDANGKCIDKDGDGVLECDGGGAWWIWTLVFVGAGVGILFATLSDNNRVGIGGGSTVVSPTR